MNSWIFRLILVLLGYLTLTLFWGNNEDMLDPFRVFPYVFSLLVFLSVIIELTLRYDRFPVWLSRFLGWIALLGAIIYMYRTGYTFIYPPYRLEDIGVFPSSIQAGSAYGAVLILLYFNVIRKESAPWKILSMLLFLSLFGIFILTQSRGPIVGLIIAFFIGSILSKDRIMLGLISCVTAGAAMLTYSGNRFLEILIIERGTSYRLDIWQCVLLRIKEKIIFGHGIFEKLSCDIGIGLIITKAHNLYLSTLFYGGLAGLILLLAVIARAGWQGWRYNDFEKNCSYLALIIFGSICVFTGYDHIIYRPHPVYLFFWLPFGFLAAYEIKTGNDHVQNAVSEERKDGLPEVNSCRE